MSEINWDKFSRQSLIADPKKMVHPVTILGCGAVGSVTALALAKMGTPSGLNLIDFDVFEIENVANQMCFEKQHIGKLKVEAIRDLCLEMGHVGDINTYPYKLVQGHLHDGETIKTSAVSVLSGICVSLPDNMKARKDFWQQAKIHPQVRYLLDARISGEYLLIRTISTMAPIAEQLEYEKTLYDDASASPELCGARGIFYMSLMAGTLLSNLVKRIQLNKPVPREIRWDMSNFLFSMVDENGQTISNMESLAFATAEDVD